MRRLLLTFVLVPTFAWVFWASCQSDDYRDTLPFRVFDAAPREAGPPILPDLAPPRADLGDMNQPMDLVQRFDGAGPGDGGPIGDGGSGDGGLDAGGTDAGGLDAGGVDGKSGD